MRGMTQRYFPRSSFEKLTSDLVRRATLEGGDHDE